MPEGTAAVVEALDSPLSDTDAYSPRRLLRHTGIYALATFGVRGLNFLLLALYSRYLLPADYALVALSDTLAAVVLGAGSLGIGAAFRRLYFQFDQQPDQLKDFVSTSFRLALVSALGFLAIGLGLGVLVERLAPTAMPVPLFPYAALSLAAAAATTIVELRLGLWQAERRAARYAAFVFLVFALTTAAVVVLVVVLGEGAAGMLLGKALAAAACALVALLLSGRWLTGVWHTSHVRELLRLGLPLVPHQLLALGLVAADRFILERYRDLSEVGIYSMAYTLGMAMYLVTSAVSLAWSPAYYDLARGGATEQRRLARLTEGVVLGLLAVATFGTLIAQDFTRVFVDARYAEAGRLVPWVIAGYLFHAFFSLMQLPAMHMKRSSTFMVTSSIALVLNIALNLWWVPRWGMYGSAWATTAAYALEAALMFYFAQRLFPIRFAAWRLPLAFAVYVGVFLACQYAPATARLGWIALAGAGAAVCFALLAAPYLKQQDSTVTG